jgi:hypothetical protein
MQRHVTRLFVAVFCISAFSSASQASFYKSLTGSSSGSKLSTTTSFSTQQLTADPASILRGSMSTEYDADVMTLSDLFPGPSFDTTALIGIRLLTDPPTFERLVSDTVFFAGLPYPFEETGYVQVSFFRKEGNLEQSVINPFPGFTLYTVNGETDGDDTHALFFNVATTDLSATATYRTYREDGSMHAVLPDYLQNLQNEVATTFTESVVSAPVPEPSVLSLGILIAGGGLLRRGGRRRAA